MIYSSSMFWNRYLAPMFIVLALVAGLNWLASARDYYYTIYWYDFMMHFLGGLGIGLFLLWVSKLSLGAISVFLNSGAKILLTVIIVGIAWEIFELAFRMTAFGDIGYAWDTGHDLVMDALGGLGVVFTSRKLYPQNQ
jgi:hypothetical protein